MADDWLLTALGDVERTAEAARTELGAVAEVLAGSVADREAGVPLIELAEGLAQRGAGPRRAVVAAVREYEQAVAALRTKVVRVLVDEEGVSLSELGRRMGLSRQAVTRLYRARDPEVFQERE